MNTAVKVGAGVIGGVAALVAIIAFSNAVDYVVTPFQEKIRNKTFEESQAYNEGMIRDLENMQIQYEQADNNGKDVLRPIIIHRFSVYPIGRLPANLQSFYYSLRGQL